jgi:hypothetical protein
MKKFVCLAVCLTMFTIRPVFAGDGHLTQFSLDFPGGTPGELVKAIEDATGKPLNVVIPTEESDFQLPPLKMTDVTVPQLFVALLQASGPVNTEPVYGFSTGTDDLGQLENDKQITDTSVWFFVYPKASPIVCQFYQLDPYLRHGFTVDDITTAIQTGWKMAGITSPPKMSYHKETRMLIAVGKQSDLSVIDNALKALKTSDYPAPATVINPTTGLPETDGNNSGK